MRRPIIAGNWKMNQSPSQAEEFIRGLLAMDYDIQVERVLCIPFLAIDRAHDLLKTSDFFIGAQNMYFEEKGAYTGEISPTMLKDVGVTHVILGHSERREIFQEDDDLINRKILSALHHDLTPILCVGETEQEREGGHAKEKIEFQLGKDLQEVSHSEAERLIIAYEPIWAIGTGKTASSDDAEEMIQAIREWLSSRFDDAVADKIRILYGGSVKPDNIRELMDKENIDGALVGGASLDLQSFAALVNY